MFECVSITQVHLNVFLIGALNLIDKGGGGGVNTDRCYKIYSKKMAKLLGRRNVNT